MALAVGTCAQQRPALNAGQLPHHSAQRVHRLARLQRQQFRQAAAVVVQSRIHPGRAAGMNDGTRQRQRRPAQPLVTQPHLRLGLDALCHVAHGAAVATESPFRVEQRNGAARHVARARLVHLLNHQAHQRLRSIERTVQRQRRCGRPPEPVHRWRVGNDLPHSGILWICAFAGRVSQHPGVAVPFVGFPHPVAAGVRHIFEPLRVRDRALGTDLHAPVLVQGLCGQTHRGASVRLQHLRRQIDPCKPCPQFRPVAQPQHHQALQFELRGQCGHCRTQIDTGARSQLSGCRIAEVDFWNPVLTHALQQPGRKLELRAPRDRHLARGRPQQRSAGLHRGQAHVDDRRQGG